MNAGLIRKRLLRFAIGSKARIKRYAMFGPFDWPLAALSGVVFRFSSLLNKRNGAELRIGLRDGQTMVIPAGSPSWRQFQTDVYEPEVSTLIERLLKPGMSVVDLGASSGYYTLLAARRVGTGGRVFAFEPDPFMHRYLRTNVQLNGLGNVLCMRLAVSNSVGRLKFARDELERGHLTSSEEDRLLSVDTTTLDTFFQGRGWPPVDFIKMDIEGAETAALEGMSEVAARNAELALIVEFNLDAIRRSGSSPRRFAETLRRIGFKRAFLIEGHMRPLELASLPSSHFLFNLFVTR